MEHEVAVWNHPNVSFEKLQEDLKILLETFLMTRGPKIKDFNAETYKRALQWCDYFKNLVKSCNDSCIEALRGILKSIQDTNSNIKIPLTDDTLLNARYVLLKSILGNPLVPNVIMKQAMLDYRHLPHLKGIEILNSDVSERIYQHQIIDILCSMGEDISAIYDLQELDSPSLSLRDLGVSSVIRDSLTSATNEIERQKVFARLAECIKTDTHCLKLFCHQLLVVDKPKPDLLDKEIVHFLLELQDEHKEFEKSLWGLKPELLNSISEKHAPFFKTYLKYIVHLYVLKRTDQDLERRIRFLLKSQKLGGPTRQYLVFKNVNAFL